MTATAVLPPPPAALQPCPATRPPGPPTPGACRRSRACRAVAYQRVLHQLVRRELRLLAELAAWAPADEAERTGALTRHAELIGRVLLHHHAVEREAVVAGAAARASPADGR